jgi:tRNA A37 threonylcarbamoyladenosine synthetase subunit TsaC/SUA5/YrdC
VISRILEVTDFPITATSANLSSGRELDTAQQIAVALGDAVELYLDAGELKGVTSTVVDCSGESLRILRAGAIPASEIAECLKDLKWK